MKYFDYSFLKEYSVDLKCSRIISDIYVTEERLKVWKGHYPKALEALRYRCILDDISSSHNMEHIPVNEKNIPNTILSEDSDMSLNDLKIKGQYEAILFCDTLAGKDILVPEDLMELHSRLMSRHDPNGGKLRNVDYPHLGYGTASTITNPSNTREVRYALSHFCKMYNEASKNNDLDQLILAMCATIDFFSISPFNNGNGRMYRLVLNLLLSRSGLSLHRYSSLEKQILDHLDNHFTALGFSTNGWGGDSNRYGMFIEDILHNLNHCTKVLNGCFPPMGTEILSKSERIRYIIENTEGRFTTEDIADRAPDVSHLLIHNNISEMISEGMLVKHGNTRGTVYILRKWDTQSKE
ncbi:MAG: Fic family protein [archaeon]|nr:Fic family protein [archaeon]